MMMAFKSIVSCIESLATRGISWRPLASKSKTNKSAAKRFTQQSDGTYLYKQAGRNHNFAKKTNNYRRAHKRSGATNEVTTSLLDRIITKSQ